MAGTEQVALKHATETTATVFYRALSNGQLSVSCNGKTFTGDTIDTAVQDGTGLVEVTGLAANTRYPFDLYLAGVLKYSGTLRTAPAAGDTWTVGFTSCFKYNRHAGALLAMIDRFGDQLAGFSFMGDFPYLDDTLTSNFTFAGETIKDLGAALIGNANDDGTISYPNIYAHHRLYWSLPGAKEMLRRVPCWIIPSDHDVGTGDNWDGSVLQANKYNAWASTTVQVAAVGDYCQRAMRQAYYKGNPSNADANNAAGWAANEQTYFSFDWGDATLIFCDHATNANWVDTYLGAAQKQWVLDKLAASTKTFKLIFIGGAYNEYITNPTTQYPEMKAIMDYIAANNITGCAVLTGDLHTPGVFNMGGVTTVRGGSCGQTPHTNLPDGYTGGGATYKWQGYYSNGTTMPDVMQVAGYITVNGSQYIEFGMISTYGEELIIPGRIYAGSNDVVYPTLQIG